MKYKKLLIIVGIFVLTFSAMGLYDTIRANTFILTVDEINPEKPIADVRSPVTIRIKLMRHGKPVSGHTLFAISLNGGTFKGNRAVTDENGIAEYTFMPYTATMLMPARPVTISVVDESNSIFIEVNATLEFEIDLQPRP